MTDRFWNVWTLVLGLLGLVIVVSLVVIGQDLRRAKTRGPRWKRRIIAAGLAILAAFGAYPTTTFFMSESPPTCYAPPPTTQPGSGEADAPAGGQSDPRSRLDLLRRFGERGILAPPVVERARKQYGEEA